MSALARLAASLRPLTRAAPAFARCAAPASSRALHGTARRADDVDVFVSTALTQAGLGADAADELAALKARSTAENNPVFAPPPTTAAHRCTR